MKYKFTVTVKIKGDELSTADLKTISNDIRTVLKESNNSDGLGWDEANNEQFWADSIDVKAG